MQFNPPHTSVPVQVLCFTVFFILVKQVASQAGYNLTTLVGATSSSYAGNGGPASSARLFAPGDVIFNSTTGAYIIADTLNSELRMVLKNGTITRYAGTGCYSTCGGNTGDGEAISKKLNNPSGIDFDRVGGVFIADKNNQ